MTPQGRVQIKAAAYAAFRGAPSRTELERFFFLDDTDRALIESKRRSHNRLGFAAQLTTVRYLGVFLDAPTDKIRADTRSTCRFAVLRMGVVHRGERGACSDSVSIDHCGDPRQVACSAG
ncbi:DUF4158 domain-containing protein [Streptomyces sp. NPDC056227]|uniref:DUF4158 domain-containing protein n=1 Tax=Streptomyces sp. NPDC056227 TaxID=3345753 RepID=UPI0035D9E80B